MEYLSIKEAAKLAGKTVPHIGNQVRAGKIAARKWNGVWMIDLDSFDEWLNSDRKPGQPPMLNPDQQIELVRLIHDSDMTGQQIADKFDLPVRENIYRWRYRLLKRAAEAEGLDIKGLGDEEKRALFERWAVAQEAKI